MKLVGATNWFVRGPFMLEGLLCGLAGSLAAVILLFLGKEVALPQILGHIAGRSATCARWRSSGRPRSSSRSGSRRRARLRADAPPLPARLSSRASSTVTLCLRCARSPMHPPEDARSGRAAPSAHAPPGRGGARGRAPDHDHVCRPAAWSRTRVVAHLGPTNSGKTYAALKELAEKRTGVYAGPLRMLAQEAHRRLGEGRSRARRSRDGRGAGERARAGHLLHGRDGAAKRRAPRPGRGAVGRRHRARLGMDATAARGRVPGDPPPRRARRAPARRSRVPAARAEGLRAQAPARVRRASGRCGRWRPEPSSSRSAAAPCSRSPARSTGCTRAASRCCTGRCRWRRGARRSSGSCPARPTSASRRTCSGTG